MHDNIAIIAAACTLGALSYLGSVSVALMAAVPTGGWVGYRLALQPTARRFGDMMLLSVAIMSVGTALLLAFLSPASAQVVAPVPAPPPSSVLAAIRPIVELIVGATVTAFLAFVYRRLQEWFGLQVEAKHRDALHSALTTSANLMLSQVAAAGQAKLDQGITQVWFGAADAIRHFGLDEPKLQSMLKAKIQEADVAGISEPTPQGSGIVARQKEPEAAVFGQVHPSLRAR